MATKKKAPETATYVDGVEITETGMPESAWRDMCAAGEAQRSRVQRNGRFECTYVTPVPDPPPGSRAPAPPKPHP